MKLEILAGRVGAKDMFVFQRLDDHRLVNLDGHGRGAGWAGNLNLRSDSEPWLARAIGERIVRTRTGIPGRFFGAYWGTEAAAVAVRDGVVVFGGDGVTNAPDEVLMEIGAVAAEHVGEVPVAKRLADELEVSQAALAIATLRPGSLRDAAVEVATRAAQALSCEFGAVLLHGSPPRLYLSREGWRPAADEEEIMAALLPLSRGTDGGLFVEQDLSCSPFPYHPLAFEDGLVARATAPLGPGGTLGILVVAHAAGEPRGFTSLCQRVIGTIADAAEPVLTTMADRDPAHA